MMNEDERAILWLAIEDFSGLWETVWQLRSLGPDVDDEVLAQRARNAVAHLLRSGWVDVYRCDEPYGELSLISTDEAVVSLDQPSAWDEPQAGRVSLRIGATENGREAYAQSPDFLHHDSP